MTRKRNANKSDNAPSKTTVPAVASTYGSLVSSISDLMEQARRTAARSVNNILTATYWEVGRRIVDYEQHGKSRAGYGQELLAQLSKELTIKHGRGFSLRNLRQMRAFFLGWEILQTSSAKFEARTRCAKEFAQESKIRQTLSAEFEARARHTNKCAQKSKIRQTPSAESGQPFSIVPAQSQLAFALKDAFPLSWSHYVCLISVENPQARAFYEAEAIRGGWSVRQLDRQISTQFYERAAHSKNPRALLARGQIPHAEDALSVEDEVRDPYLLEFLNLKDEYSETELEEALIRHMEWFLLEMGAGFTFVARQKRIRVGDTWYRIDLLLYHRALRCLVIIDLKRGAFSHADAGQMNLYLNYAREHMMMPGETDPIGIILCSNKDNAVVKYATGGIRTQVFASKYLTNLPDEETLRREILTTQRALRARWPARAGHPAGGPDRVKRARGGPACAERPAGRKKEKTHE